ncbi:MAG: FHA domain-containing protein [Aestuariibacter sp.]
MAYIIESGKDLPIYLNAHHLFGRLAYSVNTVISQPEVSRIHAVIEWVDSDWQLTDYGKNGTWLNQKQLEKDKPQIIKQGDIIHFGSMQANEYVVASNAPPQDILVAIDTSGQTQADVIPLNAYNLLPDSENPECALFLAYPNASWCVESLIDTTIPPSILRDKDLISFASQRWQLKLNRGEEQTRQIRRDAWSLDDVEFTFNLSMDEEHTTLSIHSPAGIINLDARTHHYLTLNLARYRADSMVNNVDETEQGWVYTKQLAKDLGLSETHLNIQIHRARKQLINALEGQIDAELFIQRREGQVRLGASYFRVYKGKMLECEFNKHTTVLQKQDGFIAKKGYSL